MPNYTDINSRAGKGSRLEHNVSTKNYRDGWDYAFGRHQKPVDKTAPSDVRLKDDKEAQEHERKFQVEHV